MTQVTPLTNAAVAQAALFAHYEGRLCAQNADDGVFYGSGELPGIGCAIGVALPQAVAEKLQYATREHGYQIDSLINAGIGINAEDPSALRALQILHDEWFNRQSRAADIAAQAEADFLNYAMEMAQ